MSKHTPGPWYFDPEDKPSPGFAPTRFRISNQRRQWDSSIPNKDGTMGDYDCTNIATYEAVALTMCGTAEHPSRANAALLAAAPDLLAACKAAQEGAKGWGTMVDNAIRMAEGGAA